MWLACNGQSLTFGHADVHENPAFDRAHEVEIRDLLARKQTNEETITFNWGIEARGEEVKDSSTSSSRVSLSSNDHERVQFTVSSGMALRVEAEIFQFFIFLNQIWGATSNNPTPPISIYLK